jgi:hypothetical protein
MVSLLRFCLVAKFYSPAFDFFGNLVGDGKIGGEEGFAKFFLEGTGIWGFWKRYGFEDCAA